MSESKSEILPPEPEKERSLRTLIFISVFSVIALIGVPLWFLTTSLYRAELPVEEINTLSSTFKSQIHYDIPFYIELPKPMRYLISETQELLDSKLAKLSSEHPFDVDYHVSLISGPKKSDLDYQIELVNSEDPNGEGLFISPYERRIVIRNSENVVVNKLVPDFISRVILDEVLKYEISVHQGLIATNSGFEIPFKDKLKLTFNLFKGDGLPIDWDTSSLERYLDRALENFRTYLDLRVETQVIYFASMNINKDTLIVEDNQYLLTERNLSSFINYSDWGLEDSTTTDPTLNFIIYIPSEDTRPLKVQNSEHNSFLIAQYGGVIILNDIVDNQLSDTDLMPILDIFASQLYKLIGVPEHIDSLTPKSPQIRVDIMMRLKIIKNLQLAVDNLESLITLSKRLSTINIPDFTIEHVNSAIESINQSIEKLNSREFVDSLKLSNEAIKESDRAFFSENMVQQVYFPDEHKMAVYLPLIGPIIMITFLMFLRVMKK
ncbi:BA75_00507T0 [Komagataella pastoris]|uniref:BA75_00507T0 n=1 Tax=Komagataella pastoris TaxID=4922 RepID=A0A1B2J645_PICPA|nr:BA75_00507T0 [Komagataella pastoris]